jgi:hypothetical protein
MAQVISVPFAIDMSDYANGMGISEANPPGDPQATVVFKCYAADHLRLVQDLLGTVVPAQPTTTGPAIVRNYPFIYPIGRNLIARSIDRIEFFGKPMPIPGVPLPWLWRQLARVTCRFGLPAWFQDNSDPSKQPYTTTSISLGAEFLTLPDTTYVFPSGTPTTTPIGMLMPQATINVKRHMMPFIPILAVFPFIGYVNVAPVFFAGFACAAGTLLFQGFSSTLTADPTGNITYDIEYVFGYRPRPWNQFLSPNPTEGWAVPTDGSGNPVYPSADFTQIP